MRARIWAAVACGILIGSGCHKNAEPAEPSEPPVVTPEALTPSAATPPAPEPVPAAAPPAPEPAPFIAHAPPQATIPSPDAVGYPKAGWSKVSLEDTLPLCVFGSFIERDKAKFRKDVQKQKLAADESIMFGAFGPGCIQDACDDLPSLQCWSEREGNTLVVHARYSAYHKDGASCRDNCRSITAGCKTTPLEAGSYMVKYGERTLKLKVPSSLRSPCFPTD